MELDAVVNGYARYLKTLPEAKYYAYFHGGFSSKGKTLRIYLKTLGLQYTAYKALAAQLDDVDDYLEMQLEVPKKKKVVRKKVIESDSESE